MSTMHRTLGRVPWILGDGLRDPAASWQGGGPSVYWAYSGGPTTHPGSGWARRARSRSTRRALGLIGTSRRRTRVGVGVRTDVVVIGAGQAGLSAAYGLRRAG